MRLKPLTLIGPLQNFNFVSLESGNGVLALVIWTVSFCIIQFCVTRYSPVGFSGFISNGKLPQLWSSKHPHTIILPSLCLALWHDTVIV